ncbi:MAG: hypothetical protein NVV62_15310 [Terricaulis sp.]|nr:hypothetical protein [Terricaulis sp.]
MRCLEISHLSLFPLERGHPLRSDDQPCARARKRGGGSKRGQGAGGGAAAHIGAAFYGALRGCGGSAQSAAQRSRSSAQGAARGDRRGAARADRGGAGPADGDRAGAEEKSGESFAAAMLFFGAINWTHTWFDADGVVAPQRLADMAVDTTLAGIGKAAPQ